MVEEKSTLEEDKGIAEGLDFNDLKAVAKELNAAIDLYNADVEDDAKVQKARIVGAKKLAMFQVWRDGVDALYDVEYEGIPESSVNFYNAIYADPEETEDEDAGEASEAEVEETENEPEAEEPEGKPEPKKDKPKPKGKDKGNLGSSSPKPVKGFDDLKERLKTPQSPTGHFDRICLEGGTAEQLLAKFKKFLADAGIEFKSINTLHAVKAHIEYRIKRGYVYEDVDGKIKLVGFEKS